MHTHRVEVLDRADDDDVVGVVAHHLELVFLPARDAALDEDLRDRARGESAFREVLHLLVVVRDPGAAPTEDVRGPDDDGIADLAADAQGVLQVVRDPRRRHVETDLRHRDLETLPILGGPDGLDVRADHLDAVRVEHAGRAATRR